MSAFTDLSQFSDVDLRILPDDEQFKVLNDCWWRNEDLASIPRWLRSVFKKTGKSRVPAVYHDHMYRNGKFTRKICDDLFRLALIQRGMRPWKARLYWMGVRAGGFSSYKG